MLESMTQAYQGVTNYLDLLPVELIQKIFEYLGHDLIAHVTFSKLRPNIYECCYKGLGRKFWEPKLRASGLSYSDEDVEMHIHEFDDEDWEQLAVDHVEHAETCTYSRCGLAVLRENTRLMQQSMDIGFDPMDTVVPSNAAYEPFLKQITASQVWESIMFKRRAGYTLDPENKPFETWQNATRIRADSTVSNDRTVKYGNKLVHHSIITKSFATFPPVTKLQISVSQGVVFGVVNPRGVLVADLLEEIMIDQNYNCLFQKLSDFRGLLKEVQRHMHQSRITNRVIPKGWTVEDIFDALQGIRDWFMLIRWTGLDVCVKSNSDIYCRWKFETQDLPEDYEEFSRMTSY